MSKKCGGLGLGLNIMDAEMGDFCVKEGFFSLL
jgi:hypothetical protein